MLFAAVAPTAPAEAADFVMKMGCATMNEGQHQFLKFYKEEVEKASGGRIEVQVYPASQLGPIPREIEGVQLGNIQGYIGPVDFFVGIDPRFGVFSAPLLFSSDVNAAATIHDPAIEKAMLDLVAPKRMVGIATLGLGASDYGAKKAILTLADFTARSCASTAPSSSGRRWQSSAPPASACRCPKSCRRSTRAPSTAPSRGFRCSSRSR